MYRPKFSLNNTSPAAPSGRVNVQWLCDDTVSPPNISASIAGGAGAIGITIDGGTAVPSTGSKGFIQVPYAGTITGWTLLANAAGSAQITVKKCAYGTFPTTASIVASAPPAMTGVQKQTSTSVGTWTRAFSAGDVFEFNLDSVTTCLRLTLELQITKS
jgi:hypothetical protein